MVSYIYIRVIPSIIPHIIQTQELQSYHNPQPCRPRGCCCAPPPSASSASSHTRRRGGRGKVDEGAETFNVFVSFGIFCVLWFNLISWIWCWTFLFKVSHIWCHYPLLYGSRATDSWSLQNDVTIFKFLNF